MVKELVIYTTWTKNGIVFTKKSDVSESTPVKVFNLADLLQCKQMFTLQQMDRIANILRCSTWSTCCNVNKCDGSDSKPVKVFNLADLQQFKQCNVCWYYNMMTNCVIVIYNLYQFFFSGCYVCFALYFLFYIPLVNSFYFSLIKSVCLIR